MRQTTLIYIEKDNKYLMLHRIKKENDFNKDKWIGVGGKIEEGETPDECVIREVKEETGLMILKPHLCGVKQFPMDGGRYIVFIFETDQFEGELADSEEGKMHWIKDSDLSNVNLVNDFEELIEVMLNDSLTEFQYVIENDDWIVVKK